MPTHLKKSSYQRYRFIAGLIVFGILALLTAGATIIPMIPSKQWYIRIFDYPRLQTFFIAVVAMMWFLVFYFKRTKVGYILLFVFLGVIVIQAVKAWPYTPLGKKQVLQVGENADKKAEIKLVICNVLQYNTNYDKVIAMVNKHNPDVFITTESDSVWQRQLVSLEETFPHRVMVPQSNTYGVHLYSKLRLKDATVRYLVEKDIPSIRTDLTLRSGQLISLFIVHPRPPVPTESSDSRERDAEIIMVAKEARTEKHGVIVAGDFNDVAWSETTALFQEVSGFLDPRRGRGFYSTFNAKYPIFRWPLDHLFHSRHFKLVDLKRLEKVGSDHFPMLITLNYVPEQKTDQPKAEAESDTEEKANKTIKKGLKDGDSPGE